MPLPIGSRIIDLTGNVYERLTVVDYAGKSASGNSQWLCKCECGEIVTVNSGNLKNGNSKSCGCLGRERIITANRNRFDDVRSSRIGERAGRLVILEASHIEHGHTYYRCRCDCGNITVVNGSSLNRSTRSCGCLLKETSSEVHTTHGYKNHPLYNTWRQMRDRCTNQDNDSFDNYGGRGITICQEWLDDPGEFIKWAEANGYDSGLTIDRKNNDIGYSPENCRWATRAQQNRNRRSTIINEEIAKQIRDDPRSVREIQEEYGLTEVHIRRIRSGLIWK